MSSDASVPGLAANTEQIVGLLIRSLEALAAAGEAETACRLAGQACALFRGHDAASWQRFNALLHRLVRRI